MSNSGLTYDVYSYDTLAVHGDKKAYHKLIKSLGGRWSSRLKLGGPGWLLPRDKEDELKDIIMSQRFSTMQRNAKPRQEQKKYHRSVSGGKHQPEELPAPQEEKVEETSLEEVFQEDKIDPEVVNHYKKYSQSPSVSPVRPKKKKKQRYVESSSSEDDEDSFSDDSSDSDFPVYEKKKNKKNRMKREMKRVEEEMKYLQHKLHKLTKKIKKK
jgi:hypothetical protein